MLKAILFDLDGTLLDTVEDIRACLNAAVTAFGYPEITRAQACEFIGDGAHRLIERSLPEGAPELEQSYEIFREKYAHNTNERTHPFEGAVEFLKKCKERGVKIALITNKPHDATLACVRQFFPALFDFVSGDSGAFPCKPDPTLALYAALYLRVAPAECAFVGDGETDALTAINAGMKGVSVLWGYRSKEQLASVGAKRFASSFEELEKIVFGG